MHHCLRVLPVAMIKRSEHELYEPLFPPQTRAHYERSTRTIPVTMTSWRLQWAMRSPISRTSVTAGWSATTTPRGILDCVQESTFTALAGGARWSRLCIGQFVYPEFRKGKYDRWPINNKKFYKWLFNNLTNLRSKGDKYFFVMKYDYMVSYSDLKKTNFWLILSLHSFEILGRWNREKVIWMYHAVSIFSLLSYPDFGWANETL